MSVNHLELAESGTIQNVQVNDNIIEKKNTHKFSFIVTLPLLILITNLILHLNLPNNQEMNIRHAYASVLLVLAVSYSILIIMSVKSKKLHDKLRYLIPIVTVAVGAIEVWDLVTLKFALLALPYFPGPDKVLGVFKEDWSLILKSLFYSLRLMLVAYAIGTTLGLITGISMGWSKTVNYWVMPVLKLIGPIPATAWIPIAMVVFPTTFWSSIFLIVLSVWFPVTVMTSSGIGNVRNSYFEVAKTLGADSKYLIFKVAIPAAYPMIFIGLFMGMGNSFITLIVAEMLGVKAGLGWYINWAQGWAEYNKVYACLLVIAIIFSTLLTLLFKLRDKVLIWQKGLIKW
jgi:NitT/TauT family transport system permease protein